MRRLGPGMEIGGYRIEGLLGRGGMGLVYRARQRRPERTVAIKVIAPEVAVPEFRQRFEQESSIAAQIEHPNVIPIYEVEEEGDLLYIVMRFVEGIDLGGLLREHGRLEPRRASRLIAQVAAALDAAHARGLVHRDIKPGNVLVTAGDHVYLTDFGLSKRSHDTSGLTKTGMLVGTPDYIAPEQIEGRRVDGRADVYALGCMTYKLLSGRVPFPRDSEVATIFAHLNEVPPLLANVPGPLADAVQRAMAKRPEDRFASAGAFASVVVSAAERSEQRSVATASGGATAVAPTSSGEAAEGFRFERFGQPLTVFINHRREDTPGHARLLYELLAQRFGQDNVSFDVNLEPHMDRLVELRSSGMRRGAFLALIGPGWASSLRGPYASGSSQPIDDVVRREIEWALREWPGSVIPVLVDATMPEAVTLPRSIRGLCRKQAVQLHDASLDRDVADLIERLERIASEGSDPVEASARGPHKHPTPTRAASSEGTLRSASGVPSPHDDHYADVIDGMLEGTVVPVLGARVRGSLPDADQLASYIADAFHVEGISRDLAEIAQYVAVTRGERRLYAAMRKALAHESEPTDVHLFLAALPRVLRELGRAPRPQLIISASYDGALERAFEEANEPFDYAVFITNGGWFVHFPWGERDAEPNAVTITEPQKYSEFPIDDSGDLERTVIVKIHGSTDGQEGAFKWENNYVVTEDQYIDYLPTDNIHQLVPVQILDKLKSSRCLFLGYAMRNWNARVFLRRIWQRESISEKSWAIENEPDVLEKDSWGLVGHVELLAASLPEYASELRARLVTTQDVPA